MKRWTKEEIVFIEVNYKNLTHKEIGEKLNRTRSSVHSKCFQLNLTGEKYSSVNTDERFGRLIVLNKTSKRGKSGDVFFQCKCDCGTILDIRGGSLRSGRSKSCGCLKIENFKEMARSELGEHCFNAIEYRYKNDAKRREKEYKLTSSEFRKIIKQNCHWCGGEPLPYNKNYGKNGQLRPYSNTSEEWASQQWIKVNGIDRVDSNRGYEIDNCVPCCWNCNDFKSDRSANDFVNHATKISEFQKGKQYK